MSETTGASPSASPQLAPGRSRLAAVVRAGLLTGLAAAAVNAIIWGVARAAGLELLVPSPQTATPVTAPVAGVIVFSLVPLLFGAIVLAVYRARLANPGRAWVGTVVVVTALSFLPLFDGSLATGTWLTLGSMHLVCGGLAVTVLSRTVPVTSAR